MKTNQVNRRYAFEFFAQLTLFVFLMNQIIPATFAAELTAEKNYLQGPTKTLAEIQTAAPEPQIVHQEDSLSSLSHELTLSPADYSEEAETSENQAAEESDFEYALSNLSKDYASAEIVKGGITAHDVEALVNHEDAIEVGIAVINGKIVFFTSGSGEEIRANAAAKNLLSQATLMAHTHPAGDAAQPSLADFEAAGNETEYVITEQGVWAYNQNGLLYNKALSYQEFADILNEHYDAKASTKETRDILHQFIIEIESYNQDPSASELLRSAGPTVFPNQPRLTSFATQNPPANFAVTQLADSSQTDPRIRIIRSTYNTTNGSFGGAIIAFPSPVDLSAATQFTFDFRTDNNTANSCLGSRSNCVKVEFVDNNNQVASVFATNLTSTFQQKDILKTTLNQSNPNVNYSQIKQINFVIDHNMVAGKNDGFFEVRAGGLYFEPTFTPGTGPVTNLAANTVFANELEPQGHNTVTSFNQTSTSQFSYDYNLANGADNDFSRWASALLSFGTPFNLNSQDLVLGLKATGTTKVKLDVTSGSGANAKRVTLIAEGVTNNAQFYRVTKALIDQAAVTGFDPANITFIAIVVDDQTSGNPAASGTVEVTSQNLKSNFAIAPDPTNPAVTKLPATGTGQRPEPISFASNDFSSTNLTLASQTFATLDFKLWSDSSFGGMFLTYDNPATNDNNPATTTDIETINLNAAFPNGIVIGLDNGGSSVTEIQVEVTDINNNRDSVILTNIESFGKKWKILTSQFDEIDVTKIQTISLVVTGVHPSGKLNVDWGDFAFVPPIPADLSNPAITPVPLVDNERPELIGFASNDFSSTKVTRFSETFSKLDFKLWNPTSFGGAFVSFDNPETNDNNPATTTDVEFINLDSSFANGIVLGLDNAGTGITEATLEVTDITGKRDTVKLSGIEATGKRWKVLTSQFDEVDRTKITTISLVVTGPLVDKSLNVDWGNFSFPQGADTTNPAVTKLPATGTGVRPELVGFARAGDFSSSTVTLSSQTFATVDLKLFNPTSFGGAFISYDNAATNDNNPATTTDIETINLNAAFPNGIVIGLDNGGSSVTEIQVEVTDINNNRDSVILTNIESFGKKWKILTSQFDEIDVTKIQTISLVVTGVHPSGKLNVDWGDFAFVPPIPADLSNPAITFAPLTSTGVRPDLTGFASNDFASTAINLVSATFAQVNFKLFNPNSFGGAFLNYDNPATNDNNAGTTTDIETIDLNSAFPNGIVLGLDNGGTGITEATLEITDINGNRDSVILKGIEASGKRWKVLTNQFDQIDITKVQTISLLVTGVHVDQTLNIDWGLFNFTPAVNSDGSNPAITKLPATSTGAQPIPSGFASNDFSSSTPTTTSASDVKVAMKLFSENSFGGIFLSYDNPATDDNNAGTTADIESINLNTAFPNGIVLGLSATDPSVTQVRLEVTDVNGNRDTVILQNVDSTQKRWKILPSLFDQVDLTKISTISLVVTGVHPNFDLNVTWGDFPFTPGV